MHQVSALAFATGPDADSDESHKVDAFRLPWLQTSYPRSKQLRGLRCRLFELRSWSYGVLWLSDFKAYTGIDVRQWITLTVVSRGRLHFPAFLPISSMRLYAFYARHLVGAILLIALCFWFERSNQVSPSCDCCHAGVERRQDLRYILLGRPPVS